MNSISIEFPSVVPDCMLGAICGDIAGSLYEFVNIKHHLSPAELIHPKSFYTDDTVMTCAVAAGICEGLRCVPSEWMTYPKAEKALEDAIQDSLRLFGKRYPHAGYGTSFYNWLVSDQPRPYMSWGNGSAMRVSFAGWVARSLEEAEQLARISAKVTHNHPEGIKGAVVVACCIFMLRHGADKDDVCHYVSRYYDMDFCLDEIRDTYHFDVSCAGSVPQAIEAFLEGDSYCEVISNAISIGGDSDTIAAIAGSIAETIYPIPHVMQEEAIHRLDDFLIDSLRRATNFLSSIAPIAVSSE